MHLIDELAEARINEAMRLGQFDSLNGAGKRITLEQDALVPEDLRAAYRLLKMSGHMPPELCLLNEIKKVEQLMFGLDEGEQRTSVVKRLNLLTAQLGVRAENLIHRCDYSNKVVSRLDNTVPER